MKTQTSSLITLFCTAAASLLITTWGTGPDQNFTLQIGPAVPDRGSIFGLLAVALAALFGASRLRSKRIVLLVLPVICAVATSSLHADQTMYGSNGFGGANPGALVTVDQTTGAGTLIGTPVSSPTTPVPGLTFDAAGTLYGSTIRSITSTTGVSDLITINPASGGLLTSVPILAGGVGISIGDLAFDPLTNTIYGMESNADGLHHGAFLYTIATNGVATFVGDAGSFAGGGIAFTSTGALYQVSWTNASHTVPSLNQLDPTNASRISTTPLTGPLAGFMDGLGIRSDGTFFAVPGAASDAVDTINPITGAVTLVGHTGTGGLTDLAFTSAAVSAPDTGSTFGLLAVALGALVGAHRFRSLRLA